MTALRDGASCAIDVPERFPVPFGPPAVDVRRGVARPRARPEGPGAAGQQQRLGPVFGRLRAALEEERLRITDEPEAAAPEFVLVFEIAGELDEFLSAVSRVAGLEYLTEELGDKYEDTETFAAVDHTTGRRTPTRRELFVVATNERAATELERLWAIWQRDEQLPHGFRLWKTVFERLDLVRRWDDRDRLARTGVLPAWRAELQGQGNEPIPFEVELWYRADPTRRDREERRLAADLVEVGGGIIDRFVLPEIAYHGVLAEAPAQVLADMAATIDAAWLSGNGVRFFRAVGQASTPVAEDVALLTLEPRQAPAGPQRSPRVALLDGVPVAGHDLLAGRVIVDDPDGWEETSEVRHRQHGTAMAAVILHGDIAAGEPSLGEPLYVRPIIRVDPRHNWVPRSDETMPIARLPVEVIHEAVVRMLGGDEPRAPDVRITNLSVADRAQAYDRFMSPLARLLDHLAAAYDVLFVVSAGNHDVEFAIPGDVDLGDRAEVTHEILGQLAGTASTRRLLAPAESVNALTVGAAHADAGTVPNDGRVDLLGVPTVPAATSSWGAGHARAIKPDVLAPGGRELYDLRPAGGETRRVTPSMAAREPGIQVAAPGRAGALSQTTWIRGTSPAAALVTRAGVQVLQRLDELRAEWDNEMPPAEFDAVLVKALLIHGATWGGGDDVLRRAMRDAQLPATKEDLQRPLGYGCIRPRWPLIDDDYRITALFAARLGDGVHDYRLPLPPSLAGQTLWRRVTLTLAWLTPVNVQHRGYRRAALRVDPSGPPALADQRQEASNNAVLRGTAQHELLEGDRAVPYVDGADLAFRITGRPGAGTLDDPVPYAFVVTLETAQEVGLPIYQEVSARLNIRARARV